VEPTLERVIYIGVPVADAAQSVRREDLTIGFVGRISPEKAPDVAIKALHRLRTGHGLDVALVLAGSGDDGYLNELQALVRHLLLEEHVRFLGHLYRPRVMELMAGLAVLVVPSRWQEPSGTVASEAAAVGTPVVAARSGGIPEYLPEGEAALYFEIDDVEGCARALAETLEDEEGTRSRSASARARSRDLLTINAEVEAMEEFLLEVAGQSHLGQGSLEDGAAREDAQLGSAVRLTRFER
jgi:glycosyltransferase involved in cell wall biosynthesis